MKIKNLENIDKNLFIFIFLIFFISIKPILGYEILLNQLFEKNREAQDEAGEIASIKWMKLESGLKDNKMKWQIEGKEVFLKKSNKTSENNLLDNNTSLGSLNILNRSIVFNNEIIGPDISWLVPPGFQWNSKYRFDSSIRGHNRRKTGQPFWGWNGGDAVGQFYYQPYMTNDYSAGINLGMRSIYSGSSPGGGTAIGEGLSAGFRIDKKISKTAGISFGAEQLIHFDGLTDTGRDLYLTISKGWWSNNLEGEFPLYTATFGFATGKMAEGNIKGACTDLFGGSGTEVLHQRNLC
tara:strand:+ start:133 stop:1017 length:885 start_codon:yes stop_codon:yes gene_type:complete